MGHSHWCTNEQVEQTNSSVPSGEQGVRFSTHLISLFLVGFRLIGDWCIWQACFWLHFGVEYNFCSKSLSMIIGRFMCLAILARLQQTQQWHFHSRHPDTGETLDGWSIERPSTSHKIRGYLLATATVHRKQCAISDSDSDMSRSYIDSLRKAHLWTGSQPSWPPWTCCRQHQLLSSLLSHIDYMI